MHNKLNKGENTDMARDVARILVPKSIFVVAFVEAYTWLLKAGSLPARFIVRENMGERAVNLSLFIISIFSYLILGLFICFVAYSYLNWPIISVDSLGSGELAYWEQVLFKTFIFLINPVFIFIIWVGNKAQSHFSRVVMRRRENVAEYSYYRGDSIYFSHLEGTEQKGETITDEFIRRHIEPKALSRKGQLIFALSALLILIRVNFQLDGLLAGLLDYISLSMLAFSLILIVSTFCLFLEEKGIWKGKRNSLLDVLDGEIVMKQLLEMKEKLRHEDHSGIQQISQGEGEEFSIIESN